MRATAVAAILGWAFAPGASGSLTREEGNLAYCIVVLTNTAYGGARAGENDSASAEVLMDRLAKLLKSEAASIADDVLPATAAMVAKDMTAKKRPRFSATACAGYAHFIRTTPLP
jgi:hypothetical protein